jgi:SAM-dependent methyltransferase
VSLPDGWHETGPLLKKAKIMNFNDSLLDVGCGEHSWWLLEARKFGFTKLMGADPFIKQDKHEAGINYFKKSITELEGQFRYITFHHSLEHIPDQLAQLSAVRRLLAEGGICLVRIPLVSSYAWEKYGLDWVELDAPRHLYLHSRDSIKLLAEKAGLALIDTIYDSSEFEFAASEQYRAGIPLFDERSYLVNPDRSIFSETEMAAFKQEAKRVNAECTGGRAGFFFKVA